jgi:PAS domain S-box-containing protein
VSQRQRNPRQRSRSGGGRSAGAAGREPTAEHEPGILERTAELDRLAEELEHRRAYLETVMQHIPAGLVIADAATGLITMASERAQEIVGLERGQLPTRLGDPRSGALGLGADPALNDPDELPLARALAGETVHVERLNVTRQDGSTVVLEVNAAPIQDARGEVIAAAAVFQDVTEADARARAAREFVANAAHELRTPLAAIVSGVEVLESGAKELPAERDRFLVHIGREAQRLVRLTQALLLLARIQSGVEDVRAEVVELAPLLASVADGLRPAAGVRLIVRCSPDAATIANRGLLEQALTSVATNAARYTDVGRITLTVAHPKKDGPLRIRVLDTGRGMAPEDVEKAGERFFRGGDAAGPGGFGLGLAIARESVRAIGGRLSLASTEGKGTTVDIELPFARLVSVP